MSAVRTITAKAALLDIEGTISPASFVHDVLFAYSRQRLAGYLAEHASQPAVATILAAARAQAGGSDPVAALADWQARDVKAPPLKALQGLIWDGGYRSGAFKSALFPDALAAVRRWHSAGIRLAIYSSGSRHAQELFFEFNQAGDLRGMFEAFYDTGIGAKTAAGSYGAIAGAMALPPAEIAFFSDNVKELASAAQAGMPVVHVVKETTAADPRWPPLREFGEVALAPG